MSDVIQPIYERGGADYCEAIIRDDPDLLTKLNAAFACYSLVIIAADGAFSAKKSVNVTVFIQTSQYKQPEKETVVACLATMGLQPRNYILVEATLAIADADKASPLPCLALTFQGDDALGLVRAQLPAIATLEKHMQHIVHKSDSLLSKVRIMTTETMQVMGFFKQADDKPSVDSAEQDSPNQGPRR